MKLQFGEIAAMVLQRVGNKTRGEGVSFSMESTPLNGIEPILRKLVKSCFKEDSKYRFDFVGGIELNPVYRFAKDIFKDNTKIVPNANNMARYLYDQSIHPDIRIGEFYVILFKNCKFENKLADAVGLFKSESQDTIFRIENDGKKLIIFPEIGMSLKHFDKGCLIFNIDGDNGFKVLRLDKSKKNMDIKYWSDSFLHIVPENDSFNQTISTMNLICDFLKDKTSIRNIEAAQIIDKSVELLQSHDTVSLSDVSNNLFHDKKMLKDFIKYKTVHNSLNEDNIHISEKALKKIIQQRHLKIRLDKNVEIKIIGQSNCMEQGFDKEKGLKYYKIWYDKEIR